MYIIKYNVAATWGVFNHFAIVTSKYKFICVSLEEKVHWSQLKISRPWVFCGKREISIRLWLYPLNIAVDAILSMSAFSSTIAHKFGLMRTSPPRHFLVETLTLILIGNWLFKKSFDWVEGNLLILRKIMLFYLRNNICSITISHQIANWVQFKMTKVCSYFVKHTIYWQVTRKYYHFLSFNIIFSLKISISDIPSWHPTSSEVI